MSWHKVSDILWLKDDPESVEVHINGRIGLQNTAVFLYTLREIKNLPDLKILANANDEQLALMAKEYFTTNNQIYGLAYALNVAGGKSAAALAKSMRIYCVIANNVNIHSRGELKSMGLNLMFETGARKGYLLKILKQKDYTEVVSAEIAAIPRLETLVRTYGITQ